MNDTQLTIQQPGREITLIGTAHVSRESINEVIQVIRERQPGMICVELDAGRYSSISEQQTWEKLDVAKVFRQGKGFLLMANLVLSSFQRRMGLELGVQPGEEMMAAVETAKELGIPFRFCDREVQTTLRRAWANCGFWDKCKLLSSLLSSAFSREKFSEAEIENLKNRNELEGMMDELAQYLPGVKETLIDERDRYLAAKIWETGLDFAGSGEVFKQVAVVGAGHMAGIKSHIERIISGEEGYDVSRYDAIPPKSRLTTIAGWIFPAMILTFIVIGFFKAGAGVSFEMLVRWLLLNGSLSALGAAIALGHPLSILASFIGAPIGTLSPFISVGVFSGIVEATMRKPRVLDTQSIAEDALTLKGIYRNRITRALLVFFLASLGGMAGNFISIPTLAKLLIK